MTKNMGAIDRGARLLIGGGLVALAATGTVGLWGWIGVVPLVTAALGWCPAYTMLGIKTCKARS